MNYYVIVEGKTEFKIYPKWISYCNKNLKITSRIEDISENSVFFVGANGYPNILNMIEAGVKDIKQFRNFDLLVVGIDSEEKTYNEKLAEISTFIDKSGIEIEYRVIVQNFCFETWALGNRRIFRRRTSNETLREYIKYYDVISNDPELMPSFTPKNYPRVEFALRYLHKGINDLHTRLTYSKSNPYYLGEEYYFKELVSRLEDTKHISSFDLFLALCYNI